MTSIYLLGFVCWVIIGFVYFSSRRQNRLLKKGKENNAIYITTKFYLKLHDDMVISSLYKKEQLICDNVLEYKNGFLKTTFTTIFGTIILNRFTKKYEIIQTKNLDVQQLENNTKP